MPQLLAELLAMAAAIALAATAGSAFVAAPFGASQLPIVASPALRGGVAVVSPRVDESSSLPSGAAFCAGSMALLVAVLRGGVAMRSKGAHMPKVKSAKKMALFRPRKNYGSHGARKVPRRYELYDILEEIDETIPTYTVISEPEEPFMPVKDVPLTERYPWAGPIDGVCEEKKELEGDVATRLEPYFGSFTKEQLPPWGRRQQYVFRRGWPRYNYPPWINKPKVGEGVKIPGSLPFLKDRRPKHWQMSDAQVEADLQEKNRKRYLKKKAKSQAVLAKKKAKPELSEKKESSE